MHLALLAQSSVMILLSARLKRTSSSMLVAGATLMFTPPDHGRRWKRVVRLTVNAWWLLSEIDLRYEYISTPCGRSLIHSQFSVRVSSGMSSKRGRLGREDGRAGENSEAKRTQARVWSSLAHSSSLPP
jgi:hypothetical protein